MVLANFSNPTVWIVIAVVVLVLFGGSKIPEMMRGLGVGIKEFKKGVSDTGGDDELDRDKREKEEQEKRIRARVEEEMRREADEARRQKGLS
jgi:sec-independent protein translocase protein TatA